MKVIHISDWHGSLKRLPPADLYVVTGDMLPNFPLLVILRDGANSVETIDRSDPRVLEAIKNGEIKGQVLGRKIDFPSEQIRQTEWTMRTPFRREVGIPEDAPVVCVRGNHDFIDLSDWIGGDVWEVTKDQLRTTTLFGLKIGGCRGIPYISGEWSDEVERRALSSKMRALPDDLDLVITHAPPAGILDHGRDHHFGVDGLTAYFNRRCLGEPMVPAKLHCFGHVHDCAGEIERHGGTKFSNAATTINTIEM